MPANDRSLSGCRYEEVDPNARGRGRGKKKQSVGGRFLKQLGELSETLGNTASHFIRCIKPNQVQQPGIFEGPKVIDQLKCSGESQIAACCLLLAAFQ